MTIDLLRTLLFNCVLINYLILSLWFVIFMFGHDWLYALHSRWFRISPERFDAIHYGAMALYKIGVLLFNLTPLLAIQSLA